MKRSDCLRFLAECHTDELVVSNLGWTAAEWWEVNPCRENTFYMSSSMGLVSSMALGLVLALPHRKVWALDGDGSLAMNLGALLTAGQLKPKNLLHIVWLNHLYEATGPHPLALAEQADFASIARGAGIGQTHTFRTLDDFQAAMPALLRRDEHVFVVAEVEESDRGVDRTLKDPIEMAHRFGRFVEQSEGIRIF